MQGILVQASRNSQMARVGVKGKDVRPQGTGHLLDNMGGTARDGELVVLATATANSFDSLHGSPNETQW
jgi:hypothetical protein